MPIEQEAQLLAVQAGIPLAASLLVLCTLAAVVLMQSLRHRDMVSTAPGLSFIRNRQWPVAALIVTALFLAANQLLVRGVAAGIWDVDGQFYPYFVLVADHARAGSLVTWDPWTHGGIPLIGDPQVGALSPITNLFGLLFGGTSMGFRVYWLAVWWLGGMGILILARHLGSPAWGGCVVALGFLFCGVYTGNAEHTSWVVAYSFLPLIIWRLDVALTSGRLQAAAEAGALWGLSALAGYPGVVLITGCYCALWTFGRWALPEPQPSVPPYANSEPAPPRAVILTARQAVASLTVLTIVGMVVLSPTYVSFFYEGAGTQPRVGALDRTTAVSNELQPGAVATFASPYLTVLKAFSMLQGGHADLWPLSDVAMVNIYAGALTPILALFALARRPGAAWRWWVVGLGALCLACAMGESLPLRGWLYDWFYPMRFFRHSAIFRLHFIFSLCVLAVAATRDLGNDLQQASPRLRAWLPTAAVVVAVCALAVFAPFVGSQWEAAVPRGAVLLGRFHFLAVWSAVVGIGLLAWAMPRCMRPRGIPVLLVALAGTDALLTSTLSIPTMLRLGSVREQWRVLDEKHSPSLDLRTVWLLREESACRLLPITDSCLRNDQVITKIPVFNAYATERNPRHLAMVHHPVLRRAATGAERFWFAPYTARVEPTDRNFLAFVNRAEALGQIPLVIHTPQALLDRTHEAKNAGADTLADALIDRLPAAAPHKVHITAYSPRELAFDVEVATNGWLLVTDRWARSWRLQVNGIVHPIYGGNFIFRAVSLAAGKSHVRFTYRPVALPWLVVLSWGTLAIIGVSPLWSPLLLPGSDLLAWVIALHYLGVYIVLASGVAASSSATLQNALHEGGALAPHGRAAG